MSMSIEEACHSILGDQAAHGIITEQGIHWAVVAAMAAARTDDDPDALDAIDLYRGKSRKRSGATA
jgi:hypothetical protein